MTIEEILRQAVRQGASDIHICPSSSKLSILLRVAGRLESLCDLDRYTGLINRIKMLAELDLSETRRCQDGQFECHVDQKKFFVRVNLVTTHNGEKAALRLLPERNDRLITDLGLPDSLLTQLQQTLSFPSGLIVVCGATGAGKTTTLYSCLNVLHDGSRAIFTIEDPIEYRIEGLFQCQPNLHVGVDATALLKGFLRQDPDVILVGELRDADTAKLAVSAALTGHLVLTTLHSNSALDCLHRFRSWGIDHFALVSSLKLIVHQQMQFHLGSHQPKFSGLSPAWSQKTLPTDFASLIQDQQHWHPFDFQEERYALV